MFRSRPTTELLRPATTRSPLSGAASSSSGACTLHCRHCLAINLQQGSGSRECCAGSACMQVAAPAGPAALQNSCLQQATSIGAAPPA